MNRTIGNTTSSRPHQREASQEHPEHPEPQPTPVRHKIHVHRFRRCQINGHARRGTDRITEVTVEAHKDAEGAPTEHSSRARNRMTRNDEQTPSPETLWLVVLVVFVVRVVRVVRTKRRYGSYETDDSIETYTQDETLADFNASKSERVP